MKTPKYLVLMALLVIASTVSVTRAQDHPQQTEQPAKVGQPADAEQPAPTAGILAAAATSGEFSTFLAAVEAAGLTEKLNGKGPFTIFAPTDAAFAKLPQGTVDDLLQPANQAKLAGVLACHVVPGKILAADVKTMKATNVNGQDLDIEVADGIVTVDGAKVVKADLVAGNGVIHAIDTVIMPKTADKAPANEKPKDHPAH